MMSWFNHSVTRSKMCFQFTVLQSCLSSAAYLTVLACRADSVNTWHTTCSQYCTLRTSTLSPSLADWTWPPGELVSPKKVLELCLSPRTYFMVIFSLLVLIWDLILLGLSPPRLCVEWKDRCISVKNIRWKNVNTARVLCEVWTIYN